MAINLRNRSFLTLSDYSAAEIGFLLKLAADLKTAKYAGTEQALLRGKEIALIFEKDSTRTRVGFEVAAHDQGATVTYLGPSGSHIGHKESMKDTARVLGTGSRSSRRWRDGRACPCTTGSPTSSIRRRSWPTS